MANASIHQTWVFSAFGRMKFLPSCQLVHELSWHLKPMKGTTFWCYTWQHFGDFIKILDVFQDGDSVVEFLIALGHLPSPLPPTYRQHLTGLSSQQQQVFQAISRPISSSVEMKRNERNLCTLAFILFQCISVALYAALVTFNAHTEWRNWTALNWHGLVFDELTKWASSNALQ